MSRRRDSTYAVHDTKSEVVKIVSRLRRMGFFVGVADAERRLEGVGQCRRRVGFCTIIIAWVTGCLRCVPTDATKTRQKREEGTQGFVDTDTALYEVWGTWIT